MTEGTLPPSFSTSQLPRTQSWQHPSRRHSRLSSCPGRSRGNTPSVVILDFPVVQDAVVATGKSGIQKIKSLAFRCN